MFPNVCGKRVGSCPVRHLLPRLRVRVRRAMCSTMAETGSGAVARITMMQRGSSCGAHRIRRAPAEGSRALAKTRSNVFPGGKAPSGAHRPRMAGTQTQDGAWGDDPACDEDSYEGWGRAVSTNPLFSHCALIGNPISFGRHPNCDVRIDNPAVSYV